jgi:hypothetical protein
MSNQDPTEEPQKSQAAMPATLALCHRVIEEQATQIENTRVRHFGPPE